MQLNDCSLITIIDQVNYCVVFVNQQSWLDQLNDLPPWQAAALLSTTALIWYVAWGIRTTLSLLGHTSNNED